MIKKARSFEASYKRGKRNKPRIEVYDSPNAYKPEIKLYIPPDAGLCQPDGTDVIVLSGVCVGVRIAYVAVSAVTKDVWDGFLDYCSEAAKSLVESN